MGDEQTEAALALLKRIRYHARRHALPREWLTAADEVLGTWGPVKTTHPEVAAASIPSPQGEKDGGGVDVCQDCGVHMEEPFFHFKDCPNG